MPLIQTCYWISKYYQEFSIEVLSNGGFKMKKKHYLPFSIIIFFIIISAYYVFFRDNEIEINLDKSKYIITERIRNIELDKIPIKLQLDFEKLLKDFKAVQLRKEWTTELNFDITLTPTFDLNNLYLISYDKIAVYDKYTMQILWKKQLQANILSIKLIDGNNILLIDDKNYIYTLNRLSGDIVWSHFFNDLFIESKSPGNFPFQITYNEDKRFLSSILIASNGNMLLILDNLTGEEIFSLELEHFIYYISDYDHIDNSLYVVYNDKISKIILEKK